MLTPEDQERVGLPSSSHKPSSVSQALRAIHDDIERGYITWKIGGNNATPTYRLRVACDRSTRDRAYRLAHKVYSASGYVSDGAQWCVSSFDADPQTFTVLAEDSTGRDAGTISLVFDSVNGLPCDEVYSAELEPLRDGGRWLVEVTRLAIDKDHTHSKVLLVQLFNFISIYGRRVKHYTDFIVEVNPRHVNYYRRLLSFEPLGPERPCPRVNGAPAVLLRLDLFEQERIIQRIGGRCTDSHDRSLYAYFCAWPDEEPIATFLAQQHRPMTTHEARFFKISWAVGVRRSEMAAARQ